MSTVEDSRNKRTASQRQNASSREGSQQTPQSRKGGKANQPVNKTSNSNSPAPSPVPRDEHTSIEGYNASEIENLLRRGYDGKMPLYKPEQNTNAKTQPWGTKPGAMASGKDFWLELRKQVTALQKGENMNKGG